MRAPIIADRGETRSRTARSVSTFAVSAVIRESWSWRLTPRAYRGQVTWVRSCAID